LINLRHHHAEQYVHQLLTGAAKTEDGERYSDGSIRKTINALQNLFDWLADKGWTGPWDPDYDLDERPENTRDIFTRAELDRLREAAEAYDHLPSYSDRTPAGRDRWRAYVADSLDKPPEDVTPEDWDRCWSVEYTSLIHTAIDTGLRPLEVARIRTDWLQLEANQLIFPAEYAVKSNRRWDVSLSDATTGLLDQWLDERDYHARYEGSDLLWLNQNGNPHNSGTLNNFLNNLMDIAAIDQGHRDLVWYSVRHTTATNIARESGVGTAKEQLRHVNLETTLRYNHPPPEERKEPLERF
jgi:integrase